METTTKSGKIVDRSPSRKEIELEISSEDVQREYEKILGDYAKRAKIAGFRKGLAPRDMVKKLFDAEIRREVYDSLIPRVLGEELRAYRINPVNVPVIQNLKHEEGQPLTCTVAFEVMPEFELPEYKSIPVSEKKVSVEDSEVQKALEDMQAKAAEYTPVENRGVGEGDYVAVEIQGKDLKTKKFLPAEKVVLLAGHAENEPSLNENLKGMRSGEERHFQVSYGTDHAARRLAGKDIEYRVKVNDIKEKVIPPLDDDFAHTLGDYKDLAEVKEKVRTEILGAKERAHRSEMASEILKKIAERLSLELPASVVEQETHAIMRRLLGGAQQQPSELAPEVLDQLKTQAKRQAEERLMNHLVLEKVASAEGIMVTEEEIKEEIKILAKANNVSTAQLAEMISKEGRREELRESLLFRKTVDFLVKSAIIK